MFRIWKAARERRRLNRIYDNPRAAKPEERSRNWRQAAYRRAVFRMILIRLGVLAVAIAALAYLDFL